MAYIISVAVILVVVLHCFARANSLMIEVDRVGRSSYRADALRREAAWHLRVRLPWSLIGGILGLLAVYMIDRWWL